MPNVNVAVGERTPPSDGFFTLTDLGPLGTNFALGPAASIPNWKPQPPGGSPKLKLDLGSAERGWLGRGVSQAAHTRASPLLLIRHIVHFHGPPALALPSTS